MAKDQAKEIETLEAPGHHLRLIVILFLPFSFRSDTHLFEFTQLFLNLVYLLDVLVQFLPGLVMPEVIERVLKILQLVPPPLFMSMPSFLIIGQDPAHGLRVNEVTPLHGGGDISDLSLLIAFLTLLVPASQRLALVAVHAEPLTISDLTELGVEFHIGLL